MYDKAKDCQYRWLKYQTLFFLLLVSIILLQPTSCAEKRQLIPVEKITEVQHPQPYLKAHLNDGSVCIFNDWKVSESERLLSGGGKKLDQNRRMVFNGQILLPLDSVAIFESNQTVASPLVAGMLIITAASLVGTIACAENPKACFGSCPTFYAWDGEKEILQAEGFSASVAPALEATDLDALYSARYSGDSFKIRMTNEALETHILKQVKLLAVPCQDDERVFVTTTNKYWRSRKTIAPESCVGEEGDCLSAVKFFDHLERFSLADSNNLATKEIIDVRFKQIPAGRWGLVIGSRQSLLSTFLFYQALAYLGSSTASWFARLHSDRNKDTAKIFAGVGKELGGIEVMLQPVPDSLVTIGTINETGPLACDVKLIPLPQSPADTVQIKLKLNKGHWRLNYLALVSMDEEVWPFPLEPHQIYRTDAQDTRIYQVYLDTANPLITFPGDEYAFIFDLPATSGSYEFFLESRGYYLEWIRQEWLQEENPLAASMFLFNPKLVLQFLAPDYKSIEQDMEEKFWNSRYESQKVQ